MEYWASIQHVWPEAYRGNNQKKLPDSLKAPMKAARRATADQVTTGKLAAWEAVFDPGGFLEEMRGSGTVITGSGFKIVRMSGLVLVSPCVAQADFSIRGWGDKLEFTETGMAKGAPYHVENECVPNHV